MSFTPKYNENGQLMAQAAPLPPLQAAGECTILFNSDGTVNGVTLDRPEEVAEERGAIVHWGDGGGQFEVNGRYTSFVVARML